MHGVPVKFPTQEHTYYVVVLPPSATIGHPHLAFGNDSLTATFRTPELARRLVDDLAAHGIAGCKVARARVVIKPIKEAGEGPEE